MALCMEYTCFFSFSLVALHVALNNSSFRQEEIEQKNKKKGTKKRERKRKKEIKRETEKE
jgi:hypothetical protein